MDDKKIGNFLNRVTKKDPHPVLVIRYRLFGSRATKSGRFCGVLDHWNGESIFFFHRKTRSGGIVMHFPLGIMAREIVSIKALTKEEMANHILCLFGIWDDVKERRQQLVNMRRW